jgi:hypothetical protein
MALRRALWVPWLICLLPALAHAQAPAPAAAAQGPALPSRLWVVVGGGSTSLLGDCSDCAAEDYIHSGSFLVNAGASINRRTDVGGEFLFVPTTLETGEPISVSFVMASVQFRPWHTRGFFLKAGSGLAYMRNWLGTIDGATKAQRSTAFALGLGTGWEWRMRGRFGAQVFGSQHVVAVGDLETNSGIAENVMGNFWSFGAAIVIR